MKKTYLATVEHDHEAHLWLIQDVKNELEAKKIAQEIFLKEFVYEKSDAMISIIDISKMGKNELIATSVKWNIEAGICLNTGVMMPLF